LNACLIDLVTPNNLQQKLWWFALISRNN